MGEHDIPVFESRSRVPVDTFAGRIHVEWDHNAVVTPMGQLPFIEFLISRRIHGVVTVKERWR
jgi:hypothetical protein